MAKPHKRAGASVKVTTTLTRAQLTVVAKEAAEQSKAPLEAETPEELSFSFRSMFPKSKVILRFAVALVDSEDGHRQLVSRITNYRTSQSALLLVIPLGPKTMLQIREYEGFMRRVGELCRHADPDALVEISG